jgi:hypothetical protein
MIAATIIATQQQQQKQTTATSISACERPFFAVLRIIDLSPFCKSSSTSGAASAAIANACARDGAAARLLSRRRRAPRSARAARKLMRAPLALVILGAARAHALDPTQQVLAAGALSGALFGLALALAGMLCYRRR